MGCATCGNDVPRLVKGECLTCGQYRRRHGEQRPEALILRSGWRKFEREKFRNLVHRIASSY